MIQRWQTLYIVLGTIALLLSGITKLWVFIQYLSIVVVLVAIFSYKNRQRQIKILYVLIGVVLVSSVFGIYYICEDHPIIDFTRGARSMIGEYIIGVISAVIFYILAIQRIKQDDDLIKSIDRIR